MNRDEPGEPGDIIRIIVICERDQNEWRASRVVGYESEYDVSEIAHYDRSELRIYDSRVTR